MITRRVLIALLWICASTSAASAQEIIYDIDSPTGNDDFGEVVSGGADLNGDGVDDVLVGAPVADNAGFQSGSVYAYSGQSGVLLFSLDGRASLDVFGKGVAGIRDLDGDQFDDFAVGAQFDDRLGPDAGALTVYSGQDMSVIYDIISNATEDHFGASVSSAGDVNGDSVPDFIVGAPEDAAFSPKREGYAKVFSGVTGTLLYTFDGLANGDYFGWSVAGAGDVNNDGRDDVIVGANQYVFGQGAGGNGYARVFSGMDGSLLYHLTGDAASDKFGTAVSGVGDVNGDGFDDFAVGAPQSDQGKTGYVRVFSGQDGSVLYNLLGDDPNDRFGGAVSEAGDLDGDGRPDFVVGGPTPPSLALTAKSREKATFGPYVRAFSGRTGAVLFTKLSTNEYGFSVDAAGDVNGDAVPDIVVGAPHPPGAPSLPFVQVITLACTDADMDGYGNPGLGTCSAGPETDCDDADAAVHPGVPEIPGNGKDDDCDPATPGGCTPAETVAVGAGGSIGYLALAGLLAFMARRRRVA